jgi:hypothetical protein
MITSTAAPPSSTPTTAIIFTQEFWDERYRSADRLWSGQPNPQLVAQVAGLPPGEALDAGPNCNRWTTAWPRPCARAARC